MTKTFETTQERASYGIGRQLGDQLAKTPFPDFDTEAAVAGFVDGMNSADLAVDADDINAAFKVIQDQLQSQKTEQEQELGAAGAAFLADNANKEGVTVLPSGLQYSVLVEGSGDKPSKESTVRTHYHGTLIDGTIFDSSVDRGVPAEFPVGGVIAGWTEALQLMPVGSKWRLFVPHNLAYGERGAGGKIGPFTTLVFDVELIDIIA